MLDKGQHAVGLGLAILTIEEIGKLCAVSCLLSAKPDDEKSTNFKKAQRDHATKLAAFQMLPMLVGIFASVDRRAREDESYARAVVISTRLLEEAGDRVRGALGANSFEPLDGWKQKSFYAYLHDGEFVSPSEVVSADFAGAVHALAWRAITALEFVLSDGNLERYFEVARCARKLMTEVDHQSLEHAARELIEQLLDAEGGDASEGALH